MTLKKFTYSSRIFRIKYPKFWSIVNKISFGIFEHFSYLQDKIIDYSVNFSNDELYHLSNVLNVMILENNDMKQLYQILLLNTNIYRDSSKSVYDEISQKMHETYRLSMNNVHCNIFYEKSYFQDNLIEYYNEDENELYFALWEHSKWQRMYFNYIMKYLHDISIRLVILKCDIFKMELARYCKPSGTVIDIMINEHLSYVMKLNIELRIYSKKIAKVHYYTDNAFLNPNANAIMKRYRNGITLSS
jgi:hypothetical protein